MDGIQQIEQIEQLDIENVDPGVIEKFLQELPEKAFHLGLRIVLAILALLIGMQLKAVAVPVRVSQKTIGDAHVVCARTRPKYIGGERTHYAEDPEMRK